MPTAVRATTVALLTLVSVVVLALSVTVTTTVRLLATYGVKGTQIPGITVMNDQVFQAEAIPYIAATYGSPPAPFTVVAYPASAFPLSGIFTPTANQSIATGLAALQQDVAGDPAPVMFGYSQGAAVITGYKRSFNSQYANAAPGTAIPQPTFVVIGNINRPNGGIFERFAGLYVPIVDLSFTGAMPTQTAGAAPGQITTYDIAGQYDPVADFPTYPLDLLATANAFLGFFYVHINYQNLNMDNAVLQGQYGDTAYYLIPTPRLPLLMPLAQLGVPDPILAALDPPLRVLVEAGYDRTISPGQPTPAGLVPSVNPLKLAENVLLAIPTGLDDGLQELGAGRPFGTTPAGPSGVGGRPVMLSATDVTTSNSRQSPTTASATPLATVATSNTNSNVGASTSKPITATAPRSWASNIASPLSSPQLMPKSLLPDTVVFSPRNRPPAKPRVDIDSNPSRWSVSRSRTPMSAAGTR